MSKKLLVIFACLLCGCSYKQKTPEESSDIGIGTIKFSVSSMATYGYYSRQKMPKVFVVTIDGERGFYTYCSVDTKKECRENTSGLLLAYCRERTNKICKLFANSGKVVWKNPGSWKTNEQLGMHFFVDHRGIESHKL